MVKVNRTRRNRRTAVQDRLQVRVALSVTRAWWLKREQDLNQHDVIATASEKNPLARAIGKVEDR